MSIASAPAAWWSRRRVKRSSQVLHRRKATLEAMLELVRVDAASRFQSVSPQFVKAIDWTYLLERAYREDLAPLTYNTLAQTPLGDEKAVPVQKFFYLHQLTRSRNAQASQQLAEVLARLEDEGIDSIVLKGAALAEQVYQDPGLRPIADIDILFRRRDVERGHQLLKNLDYRLNYQARPIAAPSRTDLKYRSARQYFRQDSNQLSIDLYWQLGRYPYLVSLDYEALWERASRVTLGGQSALVLAPEDALVHHSLEFILGVWYGNPELKCLRDIAEITHRQPLDWESLGLRVNRSAVAAPLYYSCALASKLLGAAVPEETLARTYPGASWWRVGMSQRLEAGILNTWHPLKWSLLLLALRLSGPEGFWDKSKWLARLILPPRELWQRIPHRLKQVLQMGSALFS